MSKYVDEVGLAHFWAKLKALLDQKSSYGHKHSYSDINDPPSIPQIAIVTWTTDDMT